MIFIVTTIQTKEQAEKLIDLLLEKKLIACGGYFPIQSRYTWKGEKHTNDEYRIEMETRDELYEDVEKVLREHHPYEEPVILSWGVRADEGTEKWVDDVTA